MSNPNSTGSSTDRPNPLSQVIANNPPGIGPEIYTAMARARELAAQAANWGDVPVGAVILDPAGQIVGEGANRRELDQDPTAHAEVLALRAAAVQENQWRLANHTLVVTLEPCAMCAGAAVLARVGTIVFGAFDPKAGATGSLWDIPRDPRLNHTIEVFAGVDADKASAQLNQFFATKRTNNQTN